MLFWQSYTESFQVPVQKHGAGDYTRYEARKHLFTLRSLSASSVKTTCDIRHFASTLTTKPRVLCLLCMYLFACGNCVSIMSFVDILLCKYIVSERQSAATVGHNDESSEASDWLFFLHRAQEVAPDWLLPVLASAAVVGDLAAAAS